MAKSKTLVTLIREIVKAEVQKEVKKIFIKENVKSTSVKPKRKESKEVSYTKNPTLNKILNETAYSQEFEEYPSMGEYDTSNMAELLGYSGTSESLIGNDETKRKVAAVQTAQAAGVDPNSVSEEVMGALTRDYRDVLKAIDKRGNK